MNVRDNATPWRCSAVAIGSTIALLALAALLAPDLTDARTALASGGIAAAPFTDLLEWLCAAAALAVATWLWIGTLLVAATAARHRSTPRGPLPAPVRRLVLVACGVALTGGLAVPAQADAGHPHGEPDRSTVTAAINGLPLPERATGAGPRGPQAARPAVSLASVAPAHRTAAVVVRPGDTLWDLAEEALPGPASRGSVATRWQRIYALNRTVVGPDPDLIRPGERLRLPRG